MKHAILSPSGASRWLTCTPSARLEMTFPDKESPYAREGTLAHSIGELLIQEKLGKLRKADFKKKLIALQNSDLYDDSMLEYCDDYATFVMEKFAEAQVHTSDAKLFLEQELDLSEWVPDGYGTGDAGIVADTILTTIDLKYGKGVAVSVEENKQQMLYALGFLRKFDFIYNISIVRMVVYQPRIGNIASWEISVEDLMHWAQTELKEKAALAFEGKGDYIPGTHCMFCKAKATCKAFANMNLELARYEFQDPALLKDNEIADVLTRSAMFSNWLTAVEDFALDQAVNNSKKWPGFKLVEGRSNRAYSDKDKVAELLLEKGFSEEIIYTKKLLGITAMEKELGKKEFVSMLNDYVIKPPGKPTLVTTEDKRPELNTLEAARKDFETIQQ